MKPERQEVFDKITKHLLDQGRPSSVENPLNGQRTCLYRGPEGLSCAAGCLIDDEHYDEALENQSVNSFQVMNALRLSGINTGDNILMQMIRELQLVHDSTFRPLEGGLYHIQDLKDNFMIIESEVIRKERTLES